jgi:hypothetical protein
MTILITILSILANINDLVKFGKEVKMALSPDDKELIRDFAHKAVSLVLNLMKVGGMTPEEIDADFAAVKKEFDAMPPDKIGV